MQEVQRSVFIARHGHRADLIGTERNDEWRRTAKRPHDPPLSELGMRQAALLARRLEAEKLDHIFASPFLRTVQTADAVAQVKRIPCKVETGLHEWLSPQWFPKCPDMLPLAQLASLCPSVDCSYVCPEPLNYPEIDEPTEAWPRAARCVGRLLAQFPGNLLLVGHGASVLGMCTYFGEPLGLSVSMGCLIRFDLVDGQWQRTLSGCTKHLEAAGALAG